MKFFLFNPLTANDELSRHENLTFFWTWILRWVPRSFATLASLCNALSSNKLCPKTVKILAVKGLKVIINKVAYGKCRTISTYNHSSPFTIMINRQMINLFSPF